MPNPILLSDVIGAIEGSLVRAQALSHMQVKELATQYVRDDILRLFKVPNFEMESIELDVPVFPQGLQARPGGGSSVVKAYRVMLKNPGANKINVIKEIRTITGLGLKEAKDLVESASDVNPAVVCDRPDNETANQVSAQLIAVGATTQVIAVLQEEKSGAARAPRKGKASAKKARAAGEARAPSTQDLLVALEPIPNVTPTVVRVRLKPAALTVVKQDSGADHYILEPASPD